MKIRGIHGLVVFAFLLLASSNAYAKITIDPGFTGTILLTAPDGTVKLIDSSSEMPEIPSGSVLDAIDAEFVIKTEAGDSVRVDCLCNSLAVSGGNSVSVKCVNNAGTVKVIKGSGQLSTQTGTETKILQEGWEETLVPSCSTAAPATADIASPNGQPVAGGPEVDSRNIESSPSR
jgi:hypothetical protein